MDDILNGEQATSGGCEVDLTAKAGREHTSTNPSIRAGEHTSGDRRAVVTRPLSAHQVRS